MIRVRAVYFCVQVAGGWLAFPARCVFFIDVERGMGLWLHFCIHQLVLVCALTGDRTCKLVCRNDALVFECSG